MKKANSNSQKNIDKYKIRTGIIYRNSKPHLYSKHAYFPSIVVLNNGDMLASIVIGEAFEAINSNIYITRSKDKGETWDTPALLVKSNQEKFISLYGRIASIHDESIIVNILKMYRESFLEEGLTNPKNMGFVPTDLMLINSKNLGYDWSNLKLVKPSLIGPAFEMCSPLIPLKDGRLLWPTSTWRGWNGYSPNGMKMIALISYDNGKTWPEHTDIINSYKKGIIFWEGKVIELIDGSLLAVAWAFDEKNNINLPNQFAISHNGGKTWSSPTSTNILGETMSVLSLTNGKILAVYRRMDKPGLWLSLVSLRHNKWINEKSIPLWGNIMHNLTNRTDSMVENFNKLRFGAPCINLINDTTVYIAFWCYEDMVSNIRWFKLNIESLID